MKKLGLIHPTNLFFKSFATCYKARIWRNEITAKKRAMTAKQKQEPYYVQLLLREDTHKKSVFFVVGPLRVTLFSINGESSPGSCIMKILFYKVRQFNPNFQYCFGNNICQKLEKKKNCQNPFQAIISGMDH